MPLKPMLGVDGLIAHSKEKGIKLTSCTDTRPVPAIVENASGSDLFI